MGKFYNIEWVSPPSDTPDMHGNFWYTVKIAGKNIRTLAKNEPKVGQVYGEITKETSKSGNTYYRLRRQQIPEGVTPPQSGEQSVSSVAGNASEMLQRLDSIEKMVKAMHGIIVPPEEEEQFLTADEEELI